MSDTQTQTLTATCPECGAVISFDRQPRRHEIVQCPDCGTELEVVATEPIRLAVAPEVEEDWGE
ncbi:MAG: lysine biosynthesis protein LysW [Phycisphaerales bacterium]|nr:lysine biosynthesis protein LysW [Phycisphaerales bacterium]